ncbi:MAG TPA: hypothetical protein VLR46_04085 [Candidatus Dormibacteraeota bacterium]|nr:hypothetical protein [Candidatus Dormibacteraeota bacterium]
MTAAGVRVPHALLLVAIGAVLVCAAILWLSRMYTFYFDEWTFILPNGSSWTGYLQPHNEHPAMLPRVIYAVLLKTVGMRTYLPYMAVLLALHATSVVLLFALVRRRAGDLVAIAAAILLLVLGAGWENLLWAFQIGFVGSVACGLGALLAIQVSEPPHPREARKASLAGPPHGVGRSWLAAVMLLASLMFSGIGLFFLVAAAIWLALTAGRRHELAWLVPIAAALGVWYAAYGHNGAPPKPLSLAGNLASLPAYVVWGLGSSVAGLLGEGGVIGLVLLVLALAAVGWTWRRHRPDGFAIGVAAALVAFYLVLGFNRAQLGYQQSGSGRYVYEGAVFWLLLLADAACDLPWRGTWRPALVACIFLACFNSGVLLFSYSVAKTSQMQREAADLQALAATRGDHCLNPTGAVDPLVMPQVTSPVDYYRAMDRYGDPGAAFPTVRGAHFDRARANLVTPGCA